MLSSQVKLTDSSGEQFIYKTTAILVISRYSNNMTVIKVQADQLFLYDDHMKINSSPLSKSKFADCLDTSMSVIAFFSQVSANDSNNREEQNINLFFF